MDLYLVRHGQARPAAEDPERGLSDLGREQMEAAAQWVAQAGARVKEIRHSGKKRAAETAEIFAHHVHPERGPVAVSGLLPDDDVMRLREDLEHETGALALVGHLPFLPRLASALLTGDPDRVAFAVMEATVIRLRRHEGRWYLVWIVGPGGAVKG
jgi:phosphohistidine phosphatase